MSAAAYRVMSKPRILVVEDDESTRAYLSTLLQAYGYEVVEADSGECALLRLAQGPAPDLALLDVILPGISGVELLGFMRESTPTLSVVMLSTVGQLKTVVEAVKRGASDYLTKPFSEEELQLAVEGALEKRRLLEEVRTLRRRLEQTGSPDDFVCTSPSMLRIREIARQVSDTDAPVLLLGESGVGKEVVARYLHGHSGRKDEPLVKVNCAALPSDLLESELFGYERGAFSGAVAEKPGKFALAGKGTILLDEIGEMSPPLQAKLLQVLQDGGYSRLGGRRTLNAEARVIALTNLQLDAAVAAGRFREDLFFRLNVIRIEIPPLRERREEIPILCNYFLEKYAARDKRPHAELPRALFDAFLSYAWPGNTRELENAVRRFVILPDLQMALAELGRSRPETPSPTAAAEPASAARAGGSLKEVGARAALEAERGMLGKVLEETRWNRREAARRLKISYKGLLNKIKLWEAEVGDETGPNKRRVQ